MPSWLPWVESFVRAFVVPAVVSAAVLGLLTWLRVAGRVAGALALAGGFFAGYVAAGVLNPQGSWAPLVPPEEGRWLLERVGGAELAPSGRTEEWHWLPWLAVLAGLAGLVPLLPRKFTWARWGAGAPAVLLVSYLAARLLVPDFATLVPARHSYVLIVAGAILLLWAALDPLAERRPGAGTPLLLAAVAVAAALVILFAESLKFAELTGAVAGTLAGCALLAWLYPDRPWLAGMPPGFAVLLVGLLAEGHANTDKVPAASFLLVAAAPLLLWVGGRGWWGAVRAAAVLAPLAVAVVLAFLTGEPERQGGDEDWSAIPGRPNPSSQPGRGNPGWHAFAALFNFAPGVEIRVGRESMARPSPFRNAGVAYSWPGTTSRCCQGGYTGR